MQSPGFSSSAQPKPHLLVSQGLGACCHPGRAPRGSSGQQAGQPGVPGEQAARTIQGSDPSSFQSACPSKHCESPTGHSCRGWGEGRGRAGGSEALTQPSNCTWLCLQPPPWGSSVGRKQKGSHPHIPPPPPPPQSCTCAPPTLTTCWPAEYEQGLLRSQSQERLGGGVGGGQA